MTTAGEVRMSPYGTQLAWKTPGDSVWTVSSSVSNDVEYLIDADVANWEPLVPASKLRALADHLDEIGRMGQFWNDGSASALNAGAQALSDTAARITKLIDRGTFE